MYRGRVAQALRAATGLTPALFSRVVAGVCTRLGAPMRANHTDRLARLVLSEAWIEAALFLIELELPLWRVRRLMTDGGEWLCSLSRNPGLPIEMDDAADARHPTMAIAILLALIEAKQQTAVAEIGQPRHTPQVGPDPAGGLCCDNFG